MTAGGLKYAGIPQSRSREEDFCHSEAGIALTEAYLNCEFKGYGEVL